MNMLNDIKACRICEDSLPFSPNPVVVFNPNSRYLIIGQAPGLKVQETNKPWNDASGERLREWLGISNTDFYNSKIFSIVPMGFCYPGRGKSGDLPPRKECAIRWMDTVLCGFNKLEKIILIGNYSTQYFLGTGEISSRIKEHSCNDSSYIVLPHPSPRNNIWLKKNEWFQNEAIINIRKKLNFNAA